MYRNLFFAALFLFSGILSASQQPAFPNASPQARAAAMAYLSSPAYMAVLQCCSQENMGPVVTQENAKLCNKTAEDFIKLLEKLNINLVLNVYDISLCNYLAKVGPDAYEEFKTYFQKHGLSADGLLVAAIGVIHKAAASLSNYKVADYCKAQLLSNNKYCHTPCVVTSIAASHIKFQDLALQKKFYKNLGIFWPQVVKFYQQQCNNRLLVLSVADEQLLPAYMQTSIIQIFSQFSESYPESCNVYRSYAQAYLKARPCEKLYYFALLVHLPYFLSNFTGMRQEAFENNKKYQIFNALINACVNEIPVASVVDEVQKINNAQNVFGIFIKFDYSWIIEALKTLPDTAHIVALCDKHRMHGLQQKGMLTDTVIYHT